MYVKDIALVAHLLYRFDFGGLEVLVAECIKRLPGFRHVVLCLTDYNPEFAKAVLPPGVEIICLRKQPGLGLGMHWRIWKLLRRLRPGVLHTYNLAALEYQLAAALAGVPVRVHAEHGRDAGDPDGLNRKHNALRRLLRPCVDCYVAVSSDLERWLREQVGIPAAKVLMIRNGVDTARFQENSITAPSDWPFQPGDFVIGTVGRTQDVKNQAALVHAFAELRQRLPQQRDKLRLAIVGAGPLLAQLRALVADAGLDGQAWLPGARADVAQLLPRFTLFALPSIAEGTPVTLLEAMACGLPVVASRVGGIPEVVDDGVTGTLTAAADDTALADAIEAYVTQPELLAAHGRAGRARAERHYSIEAMVAQYSRLYRALQNNKSNFRESIASCVE